MQPANMEAATRETTAFEQRVIKCTSSKGVIAKIYKLSKEGEASKQRRYQESREQVVGREVSEEARGMLWENIAKNFNSPQT